MKRREFSTLAASATAASALSLPFATGANAQAKFKEGKDYLKLAKPVTPDVPAGKVEVIESRSPSRRSRSAPSPAWPGMHTLNSSRKSRS